MIGRTLGHYKIVEKLGEGGMGTVYRATDTHLDRPVAVKVLRAERVADPERKRRFVQEAKSASALNHPNIIHIYDIDAADGVDFIAMEFVAGKGLDRLIGHKGMRVGEALQYAVQIADGLATAHSAGIVHRDIKPANIMVTDKGHVKILDFGLAKLTEREDTGEGAATMTVDIEGRPRTEEGSILGTVSYMSPEQAEGRKIDARSDIFSFGSVLYEMFTGRLAFQGDSKLSTLTAILREEPKPAGTIVEQFPRELDRIITRCLRKDPQWRFQHMDDLKVALAELKEESDSGRLTVAAPTAQQPARGRFALWIAVAALACLGAGLAWWLSRGRTSAPALAPTRLTSDSGLTAYPALSRDGKLVAYASDRSGEGNLDIWVQQIGGREPIRLTKHQADDSEPSFAPDGTRIAFRSERDGGGVYVMSTLGGAEQRIADQGRSPRFSPDGAWIAYWVGDQGIFSRNRVYVVAATGGQVRLVQPEMDAARYPMWSQDGKHLLFMGGRNVSTQAKDPHDWWVAPVEGGTAVQTGVYKAFLAQKIELRPRESGDWLGRDLVLSAGSADAFGLWRVRLATRTWQVDGAPERLTSGTAMEMQPALAPGLMVFTTMSGNPDIWSVPIDPVQGKVTGELKRLVSNAGVDNGPAISADGNKLAFQSDRSGSGDVWFKDLQTGREAALISTPRNEGVIQISADGARVVSSDFGPGTVSHYIVPSAGGVARKLSETTWPLYYTSQDGGKGVYRKDVRGQPSPLIVWDHATGANTVLVQHPQYNLTGARFSADERWMSFQAVNSATSRQVFVVPVRDWTAPQDPKDWIAITDGSTMDRNAVWHPDSHVLYFLSDRDGFRCFWAQRLDPATKRPVGPAFEAQAFHQARRSLLTVQEVGEIGLSAARDKLVFSMPEYTGNIWMAKLP